MVDTAFCTEITKSWFTIIYPKPNKLTIRQAQQIENYVNTFERSLYSTDQTNTDHYSEIIDMENLADYILFNEFVKNTDAFYSSTFLYKDKNGKLKIGPVWDYNIVFGNVDYSQGKFSKGWYLNTLDRPIINKVFNDQQFVDLFKDRWKLHRSVVFNPDSIDNLIDSKSKLIEPARIRNFERWNILGEKLWPNPTPVPKSYDEEITVLKNWIRDRILFMDENMSDL